jgi:hypothetical protein
VRKPLIAACAKSAVGYSSTVPITEVRRTSFPVGPISRQRNSQHAGPFFRSTHFKWPALLMAYRHKLPPTQLAVVKQYV